MSSSRRIIRLTLLPFVASSLFSVAFGVRRGKCTKPTCKNLCPHYKSPSGEEGGICTNCGHFPAAHENLGSISDQALLSSLPSSSSHTNGDESKNRKMLASRESHSSRYLTSTYPSNVSQFLILYFMTLSIPTVSLTIVTHLLTPFFLFQQPFEILIIPLSLLSSSLPSLDDQQVRMTKALKKLSKIESPASVTGTFKEKKSKSSQNLAVEKVRLFVLGCIETSKSRSKS